MKKHIKQFLIEKELEKWVKENKTLLQDYSELCNDLLFFRMKWGIEIGFVFHDSKEKKGRCLGVSYPEEKFDAQKIVNDILRKKNK